MKKYADKGKCAAPRWLVYPELTAWTIGWRMGYGEDYVMNEPPRDEEFFKLFPRPRNWLFDPRECRVKPIPLLGFLWDDEGKPKYGKTGDENVAVNDFITLKDEHDFRCDHYSFTSIEHAMLFAKFFSYNRYGHDAGLDELEGLSLNPEEEENWRFFKYTICLNACYYLFMQSADLKEKLLATGEKPLVYESDDEWGGDENLLGFALMEVRDEIRRLCENEDLIDWEYTEYIQNAYPYIDHGKDMVNDPQSAEHRVVETIIRNSSRYVRDANLDEGIAGKYQKGQILTERGFVDATDKIGGMMTTHRYMILSGYMADLSKFEKGTDWGLHTAKSGSRFKVLDVFTIEGRTQISLLHLPDGFEEVFEKHCDLEDELVDELRRQFRDNLNTEPVAEVNTPEWLERCFFPIGMSDDGEFF